MSSFAPASIKTTTAKPDPTKHVNYTLGMVLGVDDLTQEFAYLSGRDQWLARDLIGYGTVSGLEVEIKGLEVMVHPGVALSPAGQLIRVPAPQCARLDQWAALEKNQSEFQQTGDKSLYVVLCYRQCPTDLAPIPGEPCRSEEEMMQPSRWADDFKLELRFEAPGQCEEDALREFVKWLHASLEVTDAGTAFLNLEEFLQAIRDAVNMTLSPPCSSPFFLLDSPPLDLRVHTGDVCEYLRAAFGLWVTELRPQWKADYLSRWQGCAGQPSAAAPQEEDCVLLAQLRVPVSGGAINVAGIAINEERRPYLLHLRLLAEWVLCGKASGAAAAMALDDLTDVSVPAPQNNQALVFENGEWIAKTLSGIAPGGPAGGDLRGTYPNPVVDGILGRAINSSPTATNQLLVFNNPNRRWESRLLLLDELGDVNAATPQEGQVLTRQGTEWVAAPPAGGGATGPAGGDLNGNYPDPIVAKLQKNPVSNAPPEINEVLTWSGKQWEPKAIAPILPFVTITHLGETSFELWFNLDAPGNNVEIVQQKNTDPNTPVQIFVEQDKGGTPPFLAPLTRHRLDDKQLRNVFNVKSEKITPGMLLRFQFDLANIQLLGTTPISLLEYMRANAVRFMGFSSKNLVTAFFRVPGKRTQIPPPTPSPRPTRSTQPSRTSRKGSGKGKTK